MATENKSLIYICLSTSLIGIVLIYISSSMMKPISLPISDITFDNVGDKIEVVGFVTYRYNHPDGHVFITIEDDSDTSIQIPLFSDFVNSFDSMNKQKATMKDLRVGSLVEIDGIVDEYKNELQIVPKKPDDVRILYD